MPFKGGILHQWNEATVAKALFSVSCTTCHARLSVRTQDAIGEILECPKCGSMVLIVPPDGWAPPEPPAEPKATGAPPPNPAEVPATAIPPTTSAHVSGRPRG